MKWYNSTCKSVKSLKMILNSSHDMSMGFGYHSLNKGEHGMNLNWVRNLIHLIIIGLYLGETTFTIHSRKWQFFGELDSEGQASGFGIAIYEVDEQD